MLAASILTFVKLSSNVLFYRIFPDELPSYSNNYSSNLTKDIFNSSYLWSSYVFLVYSSGFYWLIIRESNLLYSPDWVTE